MREDAKTRVETRNRLWKEQNKTCPYCRKKIPVEFASLDHVMPIDRLTPEDVKILGPANLIVCCKRCNRAKGNYVVFSNIYDREIYPIIDVPVIFQDYYIHCTKKIRKSG